MSVDKELVFKIGHLARIKLGDEEAENLTDDLQRILNWVEQLEEVDTSNVEPMSSAGDTKIRMRADEVTAGGIADDVVANAPLSEDHFFVVPKVVE